MKELFIKILRFLMFVLVVALGCIGYNIYEDTLAAVWIPVGVGLVVERNYFGEPVVNRFYRQFFSWGERFWIQWRIRG